MRFLRVIIAFIVLCFSASAFAADCKTNLYFINGVGHKNDARAKDITSTLKSLLGSGSSICVKTPLFNKGDGILADLSETFALKTYSESGFITTFVNLYQEYMLGAIQLTINYFAGDMISQSETSKQLDEMTAIVKSDVDSGKKVLLVAHSEGNLFAKEIAKRVNASAPAGTQPVIHFGVAVPTTMRTDMAYSSYLTSSADGIIKVVSNSAPPTFVSSNNPDPLSLNHDFLGSYLNVNHLGSVGFMDDPTLSDRQGVDIQTILVSMIKRANSCLSACVRIRFS